MMGHYDEFNIQTAAIMSKSKSVQKRYECQESRIIKPTGCNVPIIIHADSAIHQRAYDLGVEVPPEMFEFIEVMILGAKKYAPNNWLLPNGTNSDHRSMHASLFRHAAESSCGNREDKETGLDPLLHVACRALMMYTKVKRGLR